MLEIFSLILIFSLLILVIVTSYFIFNIFNKVNSLNIMIETLYDIVANPNGSYQYNISVVNDAVKITPVPIFDNKQIH